MQKRIKIIFSYDGSQFFGSQIQNKSKTKTVMGTFQKAINRLDICDTAIASGRTDRGVHALNQVCHIDIPKHFFKLDRLKEALNRHLLPQIFIKDIRFVKSDFHARFSAKKRLYRYIISHYTYNPMQANYVAFMPKLNKETLNNSLEEFKGVHNFKHFKKNGSKTHSDTRTIYKAFSFSYKKYTVIDFLGDSFLRSQIRLMCSFLFKIDKGELEIKDLKEQLNLEKKIHLPPAPAQGLYLSRIYY